MASHSFEHAFNQAAATVALEAEQEDPELRQQKRQRLQEDRLRQTTAPMTAGDAIQRILLAEADRDYFRLLELAPPEIDALGRAVWEVTHGEISRAYRKLSVLVHPDKNPGEEARRAFEALNKAHRLLKDSGQLEGILKEHLDKAKARKEELEARATLDERITLNARQKEEARQLRTKEAEALQEEVLRQMKEKQERARKRKELALKAERQNEQLEGFVFGVGVVIDDGDHTEEVNNRKTGRKQSGAESESEDEAAAQRRRAALAKRRHQQRKLKAF
jgi:curved DNA-binding protein CbpA